MCMMCVHRGSGVPGLKPRKRRPLGLAQPQTGVQVRGVEIVQCVQDVTNSVPLVADKATLVRLYLEADFGVAARSDHRGNCVEPERRRRHVRPALNSLQVDPGSPFSLREQREDIDKSLNFRLPARPSARAHSTCASAASFSPEAATFRRRRSTSRP